MAVLILVAVFLSACTPPNLECLFDINCWGSAPENESPATEAPTPTATRVCYGDAEKVYSVLDIHPKPVTYQGEVVSWIHFGDGFIKASQYGGPAHPINNTALTEGLEYTIEIQIKINANTMGVLRMKGFVCGDKFYFYLIEEANPFFIG